ncbi:unnamed protein product [Trichogramma brassicae]|uniref:Uncharacterized protein n=1 Tax=Trichogramma brassicae TaxID=86971 RepID=A0A6H5I0U7_9HYME|nr:unnamed protein product [Trichogramma brassicae]
MNILEGARQPRIQIHRTKRRVGRSATTPRSYYSFVYVYYAKCRIRRRADVFLHPTTTGRSVRRRQKGGEKAVRSRARKKKTNVANQKSRKKIHAAANRSPPASPSPRRRANVRSLPNLHPAASLSSSSRTNAVRPSPRVIIAANRRRAVNPRKTKAAALPSPARSIRSSSSSWSCTKSRAAISAWPTWPRKPASCGARCPAARRSPSAPSRSAISVSSIDTRAKRSHTAGRATVGAAARGPRNAADSEREKIFCKTFSLPRAGFRGNARACLSVCVCADVPINDVCVCVCTCACERSFDDVSPRVFVCLFTSA